MKQLKRLDASSPDPYRRAVRSRLRHLPLTEEEFRFVEREQPDHVVIEDEGLLLARTFPGRADLLADLHYAYPSHDAFVVLFPDMLRRLLRRLSQAEAPLGLRLRWTDASSRPYVEPVLIAHAFELSREWLRMECLELPEEGIPAEAIATGFRLRPALPEDADTLVDLDTAAFASPALSAPSARAAVETMPAVRILEDRQAGQPAGILLLRTAGPAAGYVAEVALLPQYQRRGLGEAMMRWAHAWFRLQGMRRSVLTVNIDNGPAIALYRKLGYVARETGLDYRRPIDEDEVRQVLEKHRAQHIRVRRRI